MGEGTRVVQYADVNYVENLRREISALNNRVILLEKAFLHGPLANGGWNEGIALNFIKESDE